MHSRRRFFRRCAGLAAGATATLSLPTAQAQSGVTEGIDVSHWQGTINWGQVYNAGVRFVIMKATEGTTYTDDTFANNWVNSKAAGLVRSAYHFARFEIDPIAQARYFYNTVRPASGDLPLALDFEERTGAPATTAAQKRYWCQRFVQELRRKLGRPPLIYTGFYFWRDDGANSPYNYGCPLWMARWGVPSPNPLPGAWSNWTFWQYTSTGSVSGITGNVDRDQYNGSLTAMQSLFMP